MEKTGRQGGFWPFGKSPDAAAAERLLTTVTAMARQPGFYGEGRVSDTLDGRMELIFLHAALLLHRLKSAPEARAIAQAFTDRLFRNLDEGLREAGVGDLSVPRKMRTIAGAFYGRLAAYEAALAAPEDMSPALARNILGEAGAAFGPALAAYVGDVAAALAAQPVDRLDRLDSWKPAPA